jgi:4-diphosphocytidyl-2-C-methyl-D-erythritol kinase
MAQPPADPLVLSAPAKINLYLEVLGSRADGYHEIVTCMTPLALADELTFRPAGDFSLACDDPLLPLDENNLVIRAARAWQQHTGRRAGAAMELKKRIPVEAGLGGGSSNAAKTLQGLGELWQTPLPQAEMMALAAQLGSDVPFFLLGKAAWCRGRGIDVEAADMACSLPLLLISPLCGLRTADVYRAIGALPAGPRANPKEALMRQALAQGDLPGIGAALFNRLQPGAERLMPLVADIRRLLDDLAPHELYWGHQMSGSGSSYVAICRGENQAQRLARLVSERWAGGVATGMGTAEPKEGPPERTIRLLATTALASAC